MALSYSRLNTFENCPASFDYQYVSKLVKGTSCAASEYGNRVHEVLELHGKGTLDHSTLTEEGRQTVDKWGGLVDKINSRPGEKYYEHQMTVNRALQPVDWFASDAWMRSIADILVVSGDTAYVFDHKTGKVRDNPTQLQLFALMVFWHFPKVTKVVTAFLWLKFDEVTNATYQRRYSESLWGVLEPRFDKVQEVIDLGVFDTKPSGLCPWCPAKDICPDARLGRRRY